jgi:ribA/ribD-fused uncharacterized protein
MFKIDSFSGDYKFLSNFYPCSVELDGIVYPTVEHAYQAAKTIDPHERQIILETPQPNIAKKLGRYCTIRKDWDDVKLSVMSDLVWQKFSGDETLKSQLLATGDAELVEGNWWNDTYWGVCRGQGHNNLGKILMLVRNELKNIHM